MRLKDICILKSVWLFISTFIVGFFSLYSLGADFTLVSNLAGACVGALTLIFTIIFYVRANIDTFINQENVPQKDLKQKKFLKSINDYVAGRRALIIAFCYLTAVGYISCVLIIFSALLEVPEFPVVFYIYKILSFVFVSSTLSSIMGLLFMLITQDEITLLSKK